MISSARRRQDSVASKSPMQRWTLARLCRMYASFFGFCASDGMASASSTFESATEYSPMLLRMFARLTRSPATASSSSRSRSMARALSVSASASAFRPSCQRSSPTLRRMFRSSPESSSSRLMRSAVLSARSAPLNRLSSVSRSPSRRYVSASRADGPAGARCAMSLPMICCWRRLSPVVSHARSCWSSRSVLRWRRSSSSGRRGSHSRTLSSASTASANWLRPPARSAARLP